MIIKNGFPTKDQELLLKASLTNNEFTSQYFDEWYSRNNFENIDHISFRLLPLLYNNLTEYLRDFNIYPKLRGIYLKNLYVNKIALNDLTKIIENFKHNDIEYIILKGSSLMLSYYKSIAERPLGDMDIIVRNKSINKVVFNLRELNYNPILFWDDKIISYCKEWHFVNNNGHLPIDLHWNLFEKYEQSKYEEQWNNTQKIDYNGNSIVTLNPTFELLNIIIHGFRPHFTFYPTYWVADSVKILRKSKDKIDWNLLLFESRKLGYYDFIQKALDYITINFEIPLPILNKEIIPIKFEQDNFYNSQFRTNFVSRYYWKFKRFICRVRIYKSESIYNLLGYLLFLIKFKSYGLLAKFNFKIVKKYI